MTDDAGYKHWIASMVEDPHSRTPELPPGTFYKLVDLIPVPCTLAEWVKFCGDEGKHIDFHEVVATTGEVIFKVSTIFLGVSTSGYDIPRVFETMVWEQGAWGGARQHSDFEGAQEMHQKALAELSSRLMYAA